MSQWHRHSLFLLLFLWGKKRTSEAQVEPWSFSANIYSYIHYRGADNCGPEALKMVVGPLDFHADEPHWPLKIWSVATKIIND